MLSPPSLSAAAQILLGILVTVAAVFDVRFRRIPNWLVLAGIVAGLVWSLFASGGAGLGRSAAGLAVGFLLYFPLYLLKARGAGDVKLLAAAGSILGPGDCFRLFLLTAVVGGVIALCIVVLKRRTVHTFFNVGWIVGDLMRFRAPHRSSEELDVRSAKGLRLPHGAMLAAGSMALIFMAQRGISI